jgi:hypothetical protein
LHCGCSPGRGSLQRLSWLCGSGSMAMLPDLQCSNIAGRGIGRPARDAPSDVPARRYRSCRSRSADFNGSGSAVELQVQLRWSCAVTSAQLLRNSFATQLRNSSATRPQLLTATVSGRRCRVFAPPTSHEVRRACIFEYGPGEGVGEIPVRFLS